MVVALLILQILSINYIIDRNTVGKIDSSVSFSTKKKKKIHFLGQRVQTFPYSGARLLGLTFIIL